MRMRRAPPPRMRGRCRWDGSHGIRRVERILDAAGLSSYRAEHVDFRGESLISQLVPGIHAAEPRPTLILIITGVARKARQSRPFRAVSGSQKRASVDWCGGARGSAGGAGHRWAAVAGSVR